MSGGVLGACGLCHHRPHRGRRCEEPTGAPVTSPACTCEGATPQDEEAEDLTGTGNHRSSTRARNASSRSAPPAKGAKMGAR